MSRGQWHKDVTPFWPFWEKFVCVSLQHLGLKELSLCFTSHWLHWVELSLCVSWKAHIFLNILISNTHFGKIWSYVFVSLNPWCMLSAWQHQWPNQDHAWHALNKFKESNQPTIQGEQAWYICCQDDEHEMRTLVCCPHSQPYHVFNSNLLSHSNDHHQGQCQSSVIYILSIIFQLPLRLDTNLITRSKIVFFIGAQQWNGDWRKCWTRFVDRFANRKQKIKISKEQRNITNKTSGYYNLLTNFQKEMLNVIKNTNTTRPLPPQLSCACMILKLETHYNQNPCYNILFSSERITVFCYICKSHKCWSHCYISM